MKNRIHTLFAFLLPVLLTGCSQETLTLSQLSGALAKACPGDTLRIKNGVYIDCQVKLHAKGVAGKPVVVIAEEAGKVILSGKSNLRIAGEYVEVNGFCFQDGQSPEGAVIEFRSGKEVANNSRVTNCAIHYYNPENRGVKGNWVLLYGRNNRFDHNSLIGKLNPDVTLAVILDEERNQNNHHLIEYNYFGKRPLLGSNGGETLRVGTSHHAFSSSNTEISHNIFEECDGEVEVVSIKSSDNVVKNNLFQACSGVLALRHGNRNTVMGNAFIGNDKPFSGGIRVVNEGHRISENLFYKLKGTRFFGALGLMNAVPNSLPNRYHHVKDVVVENNRFVHCDHIYFGVGKDNERTQQPSGITFKNNSFYHEQPYSCFTAFCDLSGFMFSDNKYNYPVTQSLNGFREDKTLNDKIDLSIYPQRSEVGVSYPLMDARNQSMTGLVWKVKASELENAIHNAAANDTIELIDSVYYNEKTLLINKPLTLRGRMNGTTRPVLRFNGEKRCAFITLANNGSLRLEGIAFNGDLLPGKAQAIGALESTEGMITPYALYIDGCEFSGFNESGFAAIRGRKSTFAPEIIIENSLFHEMSGEGINFADEKDDKGIYNVENLIVRNCTFYRLLGAALNIYRGGNDESTSGPTVRIEKCLFHTVNNKEQGSVLRLIGTQIADIKGCEFVNSGQGGASIRFDEMRWDNLSVADINLWESGRIASFWGNVKQKNITSIRPKNINLEK